MKIRHLCALLGIALAAGGVLFIRSLVTSNDAQATVVAERLLTSVPLEADTHVTRLTMDYRPGGHVMQGPPMMVLAATRSDVPEGEIWVTRALFAQRRLTCPAVGSEQMFLGQKGAYRLKITKYLPWEKPVRGYPNVFMSPATAARITEEWIAQAPPTVAEVAPFLMSDGSRNFDRSKALLLWAAVLTALSLLVNSLFLSVEARRRGLALMRVIGLARGGVLRLMAREALGLALGGALIGLILGGGATALWTRTDPVSFPEGMAIDWRAAGAILILAPILGLLAMLWVLRPALAVKPLELVSRRTPRRRGLGMMISFACGFGAFVAVEVWGTSLTASFIPSPEWPDAIVSILPGGVSSFQIERLRNLEGVKWISELQPLQVNLWPLEELKGGFGDAQAGKASSTPRGKSGRPPMKAYRNALLLASERLPDFRFVAGDFVTATNALATEDACIITEMMARARGLKLGDNLRLACGDQEAALQIAGIVDLRWHMVTSRGLVRGMNRMPVNTDGPVFVSFDVLASFDWRPQAFVQMTHLWLDYEPDFLARFGVFEAGRRVESAIRHALGDAVRTDDDGNEWGNTVRLHARDEVADGTIAHGNDLVGAMARIPYIFLVIISLGFIAMIVASADARAAQFRVMRAIGATRLQIAAVLWREVLWTAAGGVFFGLVGGSLFGWLATFSTRSLMANWGLPPSFYVPFLTILRGALGALAVVAFIAIPTALTRLRPQR